MFLFIGGITPGKPERWQTLKAEYCPHCHNTTRWILEKRQYYFSLFFIPLFPVKTDRSYYCPICGFEKAIDKDSFEQKIRTEAEKTDA